MKNYDFIKFNYTQKHPMSLSWDITNRCNLNCKHCFNNSGNPNEHNYKEEFSYEQAIAFAKQIVDFGVNQVCLCGGETTLCEFLFDIIKILSDGGVTTNMVSNGLLIDEDYALKLKNAGINAVQISLDGLGYQHDMFRNKKGAFDKAVKAIISLRNNNIYTMVSCCPNKYNYRNFEEYVNFLVSLNCNELRMMPLLPLGRGSENYEGLYLDTQEMFEFVQNLMFIKSKYSNIKIDWGDPLQHIALAVVNKRRNPAVMSILSNGDVGITPYINIVVGNVLKTPLKELWEKGYDRIWAKKEIYDIVKEVKTIPDLAELPFDKKVLLL